MYWDRVLCRRTFLLFLGFTLYTFILFHQSKCRRLLFCVEDLFIVVLWWELCETTKITFFLSYFLQTWSIPFPCLPLHSLGIALLLLSFDFLSIKFAFGALCGFSATLEKTMHLFICSTEKTKTPAVSWCVEEQVTIFMKNVSSHLRGCSVLKSINKDIYLNGNDSFWEKWAKKNK